MPGPPPADDKQPDPAARPPTYQGYKPPRTTAEGGATMLVSAAFALGAVVAMVLAAYSKLFDSRTFGQITNLLTLGVALLLLAIYILVWEIVARMIARDED